MHHLEHCRHLAGEIDRFAGAMGSVPGDTPVPSCPEWSATELARHLGTIHRWAERLVRQVAPQRIPAAAMGLSEGPVTPAWLAEGGAALVATLRAGDPDAPMWAWGADQHLRFWSRRQLHETLVHRADLELAAGRVPHIDQEVAADAVDEFLVNLPGAARFSPEVHQLRGQGRLRFRALDTADSWTVTFVPQGFELGRHGGPADAEVAAPAATLLLVLYRRLTRDAEGVELSGDPALAHLWFDHSALE